MAIFLQTEIFLEPVFIIMKNKYNLNFSIKDLEKNINRLTNQIWKLIPMRENDEN